MPLDSEKRNLLIQLIALAKVDNSKREKEYQFLLSIAELMGVSESELNSLFSENISFQPPKNEFERILQFHRLVLVMNIDSKVDSSELNFIRNAGIKMGLNPIATEKVLEKMRDYENGLVPPDLLIKIFQQFHN